MRRVGDGLAASFGDISVSVGKDDVGVAELGRPPDNFFDAALIASLADAYDWLSGQVRAIVLGSAGKNFCAGADFTGRSGAGQVSARELYDQAARLFAVQVPVVAAVQGAAVGGGLGLACSADFRVAGPRARFSANFARIGLHQGFGLSVTLRETVGKQRAADLLYTGRRVGGEEALRIGLADRLTASEDPAAVRAAARELAAEIAGAGPLAVRAIRATMRAGLIDRVKAAMEHELAEQELLWQTADFSEGVRASAERRAPRFEGR